MLTGNLFCKFAKLKRQHFKLLEEVVCNVGDKQPTTETNNSSFLAIEVLLKKHGEHKIAVLEAKQCKIRDHLL